MTDDQQGIELSKVSPHILHKISVEYGISYKSLMIAAGHLTERSSCNHVFDRTESGSDNPATDEETTCKKCGFNWMTDVKFGPVKRVTNGGH